MDNNLSDEFSRIKSDLELKELLANKPREELNQDTYKLIKAIGQYGAIAEQYASISQMSELVAINVAKELDKYKMSLGVVTILLLAVLIIAIGEFVLLLL